MAKENGEKDQPKNVYGEVDSYITAITPDLQLLGMEELIITIMTMQNKFDIFPMDQFVSALGASITGTSKPEVALLSVWLKYFKEFLVNDERMTPENVEEGIKYYRTELNTAKGRSRK